MFPVKKEITKRIKDRISKVINHGQFIMGPEVFELERKLQKYTGFKYCVTCSSGTDALMMSMMAMGLNSYDNVIMSPFTFVSAKECVENIGAHDWYVDINIETLLMGEVLMDNIKNKHIILTDIFGRPNDSTSVHPAIIDAAQSFGSFSSDIKENDLLCTSFFPTKPFGCFGDGGAIFTNSDEQNKKLVSIREHGRSKHDKYKYERSGINGRLDTIQAAVLLEKLKIFPEELKARRKIASQYYDMLGGKLELPEWTINHSWAQFVVLAENSEQRAVYRAFLKEGGVDTAVYYPSPLSSDKKLKVANDVCSRIFSIPMHPYLTEEDIFTVVWAIKRAEKVLF